MTIAEAIHERRREPFRAAYLPETSTCGEILLSLPDEAALPAAELREIAVREMAIQRIDVSPDEIVIGMWTP